MLTATTPAPRRQIAALALLCAVLTLLPGCSSVSTRPEIEPTPPRVDCQKGPGPLAGSAPAEQVSCDARGCRLSEAFSNFVLSLYGVIAAEKGLRADEHACLDEHERRGIITH